MNPVPEMLILAGGFGTRLRSVVSDVPKPLAPVAGRPFLYYLIERWIQQGATKLTLLLHHEAPLVEKFCFAAKRGGVWRDCQIRTLVEPTPLGTGGAVAYAVQQLRLTGSFLVANADTWVGSGVQEISAAAPPSIATIQVQNTERYGRMRMDGRRVMAFEEKQASEGPGWINAGLYHLHANYFTEWDGCPFSLEGEIFPALASYGELSAVPLKTDFIDIGIPDDYFRFCRWIETDRRESLCI